MHHECINDRPHGAGIIRNQGALIISALKCTRLQVNNYELNGLRKDE